MNRLNAITRISLCLSFLAVGGLLLADAARLMPDAPSIVRRERQALAESIAVHCSVLASRGDFAQLGAALRATADRNKEIASIGLRNFGGRLLVDIGGHAKRWQQQSERRSHNAALFVPIYAGDKLWGYVEMSLVDSAATSLWGSYDSHLLETLLFVGIFSFCAFYLFLRRVLLHLDPTRVVPDRVRRALDALTGGLLLIDDRERIVLANQAFANTAGTTPDALQGRIVGELPWTARETEQRPDVFPWQCTLQGRGAMHGETLGLKTADEQRRIFLVNSSPIVDDGGAQRGAIASFEDVTLLERKRDELVQVVTALKDSQAAVRLQNEELRRLATRDALTGCLNRRALFEYFEMQWSAAERYDVPLSCVMLDIDHFKSINDAHGHAMGDKVLVNMGAALRRVARESDAVGRYGGEEFCVLLTNTDLESAVLFAERCRKAVAALNVDGLRITISIGLSARHLGAATTQQLLEQSDQALYAAKHAGRNRVVCWDQIDSLNDSAQANETPTAPRIPETTSPEPSQSIPFNAVNALLSALAYRDSATAAHSTRVADLCAAMARGRMSLADAYVLEIAAMLHDIGKIGVPDSILLKPGRLTADEWDAMRRHERIGVEIIASSFAHAPLTAIVRERHAPFGGDAANPAAHVGPDIPLGARILCIADAFDSMVAESVYRPARSTTEAIAELRRCAGSQFDPQLIADFIQMVQNSHKCGDATTPRLNRDAALNIGQQVERIAQAVDELDLEGLGVLADRLQSTAAKNCLDEVSRIAAQLKSLIQEKPDAVALVETTFDLMNLSRRTLQVHVDDSAGLTRAAAAPAGLPENATMLLADSRAVAN